MELSLSEIKKRFDLDKPSASMFFLMMAMLPPGDFVETVCGRIEKTDEETLKLVVDEKTISNLSKNFLVEDICSYEEMFGHLPVDQT